MPLLCCGVSHHTAPLAVRERLSVGPREASAVLGSPWLRGAATIAGLTEIAVLSTCNRTELYASVGAHDRDLADATALFMKLLSRASDLSEETLAPHVYMSSGLAAVEHLCRVAAGLESMVVGETEILGQVGVALGQSVEASWSGPVLEAVFHTALRAGRRARAETGISRRPVSIASEAVALLRAKLVSRERPRVLVLGTGSMGRAVARVVANSDFATVHVAGRTASRACELAKEVAAELVSWDALADRLSAMDAVVVTTSAPEPVITVAMMSRAQATRQFARPQLVIDVSMPRNVEPEVASIPGVALYDLDHIQAVIGSHLEGRRLEIPMVDGIIEEELAHFDRWRRGSALRPVLAALQAKGEAIRRRQVDEHLRAIGSADPDLRGHFDAISRAVVSKLLHEPSRRLRTVTDAARARESAELVRELFDLELPDDPSEPERCSA
ncbi:MAG: glutamyl-tRNA reductase [Gemmatimonadales bacterium]|nr:glutamyl-tRNA reductase [Gemmatimonadales bacterium]